MGGISAQNPGVRRRRDPRTLHSRGATGCCRLSRQLLVRLSTSSYSGLCLRSGLLVFCGLSLEGRSAEEDRPANLRPRPLFVVSAHTDRLHDFLRRSTSRLFAKADAVDRAEGGSSDTSSSEPPPPRRTSEVQPG